MKRRQNSMVSAAKDANSNGDLSSGISTPPRSRAGGAVVRASSFAVGEQSNEGEVLMPPIPAGGGGNDGPPNNGKVAEKEQDDRYNYALLIALYTLQGIPMGLSASIPFLIQQKVKMMTEMAAASAAGAGAAGAAGAVGSAAASHAAKLSYNANAIFALCSWPFSLKLLWAPIVDAVFFKRFGRRKSWLVPVQTLAGLVMVFGAEFVERQLGLGSLVSAAESTKRGRRKMAALAGAATTEEGEMNVKGVTIFFFVLYFLMATQDIAVDGWALTMLSKKNRGRGPVCNSIGQNIGYFLSFVGFLALNDPEASEDLWRPLLGLPSNPESGLVSLGTFVKCMGYFMLTTTLVVALIKREVPVKPPEESSIPKSKEALLSLDRFKKDDDDDDDAELDASEIGLRETYHRLWAVCQLPSVQTLFMILLTYRLPTALGDNVKFLKAVEYGLSKSTTALLSPTVILPLGILVPIVATKIWHGHPLGQFMTAYHMRIGLVPLLDLIMLAVVKRGKSHNMSERLGFWLAVIASTTSQATASSLQFNAQMTFFASRVDPAIGGSYMTLLNTAANLGGTWPSSFIMWLVGVFTEEQHCSFDKATKSEVCTGRNRDPYVVLQLGSSVLGLIWILLFKKRVQGLAKLPDDAWRTHLLDADTESVSSGGDVESPKSNQARKRIFSKNK